MCAKKKHKKLVFFLSFFYAYIVIMWYLILKMRTWFYCPTLGGLKSPPFRRQLQHFFFFTFGSYDAYGNTWSAQPSSEIS
jgi:hypothetical protein